VTEPSDREHSAARIQSAVGRLHDLREGPRAFFDVVMLGRQAVPALEALLRGRSESVHQPRCLAADALSGIGGAEAVDALLRALLDSVSRRLDPVLQQAEEVVVSRIAEHLGHVREARVVDALLAALRTHPYRGCATALGMLGETQAIPLLVECLHDDFAREPAMDALRRMGQAAVPELTRALMEPYVPHESEGSTWVDGRAAAASLLGDIGCEEAISALARALRDGQRRVRLAAAIALCARGGERARSAVPVLVEALGDEDWNRSEEAMQALAGMGPPIAAEVLPLLAAPSGGAPARRHRLRGVELLARLAGAEAIGALRGLEEDADAHVRLSAVSALARLSGAEATKALVASAGDSEAAVRARALEALFARRALDFDAAVPLLGDAAREVREIARRALRAQGRAALPALGSALRRLGAPLRGFHPRATAWWGALCLEAELRLPWCRRANRGAWKSGVPR
jgi:HEAT repeat protein